MNPLLKAAAQAHGGVTITDDRLTVTVNYPSGGSLTRDWNPLEDNGDAFELLVLLSMRVDVDSTSKETWSSTHWRAWITEPHADCRFEATRRAITVSAAESVGYEVAQ